VNSDRANVADASSPEPVEPLRFAAVILAGGTGQRLGGTDKAALRVGDQTLLEHALEAVQGAQQVVVVGPTSPLPAADSPSPSPPVTSPSPPVTFTREDPPGGGPAAGLLAGLDGLGADVILVMVLAVDMAGVTAATVTRLAAALTQDSDGVFLSSPDGRRQLAGLVRLRALDDVRPAQGGVDGLPMHRLLDPLRLTLLAAEAGEATDIDHWADLARHQQGLPRIEG
jgi:molybdopterin-guanine dinucleotide biosynthesis protein A